MRATESMVSLKGFVFLAWISFGLGSVLFAVIVTAYDRMLIFKEPIADKALSGHVKATEQVPNEGSCRVKCYMKPNCVSINVGPGTDGQLTCELNNHTDESSSRKQILLEEKRGFTHFSVENSCLDNPCRGINAPCQVGFSSSGYRCACVGGGHTPAADCREPLGMENGDIRDKQISASSARNNRVNASVGRLHYSRKGGAWVSNRSDSNEWLQIDLLSKHTIVTGVATQGRKVQNNSSEKAVWVTKYKLQYGDDGKNFKYYSEKHTNGGEKEFDGNTDQDTVVDHDLNPPIRARYIRFRPMDWKKRIAMRVELYGCQNCVNGTGAWPSSNYVLFTKRRTWNDARANCQRLGADLVKIESDEENAFIETKFLNISGLDRVKYWIGLRCQLREGKWMWTDGSLINNATYNNWGRNQPDNFKNNENCTEIITRIGNGHHYRTWWNDVKCQAKRGYVCEMGQF